MSDSPTEATRILSRFQAGDQQAAAELLPLLYGELKRIAAENMGRERASHTLQPTALVHEAWMRILGPELNPESNPELDPESGPDSASKQPASSPDENGPAFHGREHFLKTAAQVMRHILVDHARARNAAKRGGGAQSVELDEVLDGFEAEGTNLVELDDALERLAQTDPDLARIVELRTFGGLTMAEVAAAMDMSKATAERRAKIARIWLMKELGPGQD